MVAATPGAYRATYTPNGRLLLALHRARNPHPNSASGVVHRRPDQTTSGVVSNIDVADGLAPCWRSRYHAHSLLVDRGFAASDLLWVAGRVLVPANSILPRAMP